MQLPIVIYLVKISTHLTKSLNSSEDNKSIWVPSGYCGYKETQDASTQTVKGKDSFATKPFCQVAKWELAYRIAIEEGPEEKTL